MMKYVLVSMAGLLMQAQASAATLTAEEAQACNVLAASFTPKKAAFEALAAERDGLVLRVEDAGDAWESAEALRNFSTEHSAEADTAEAVYNDLVAEFEMVESRYVETGTKLNEDFADYNAKCASKAKR